MTGSQVNDSECKASIGQGESNNMKKTSLKEILMFIATGAIASGIMSAGKNAVLEGATFLGL